MSEEFVDLGSVTTPSGVLVLGMASWIDHWPELGLPLSERARAAVASGGGHLWEQECEAVAVAAAGDRPLRVRARTAPSWYTDEPTISLLEVELALPWTGEGNAPIPLGDLPVDRGGMVLGDGSGLDAWTGIDGEPADGLADVTYWGLHADDAHARFGGQRITMHGAQGGPWGRLDLPVVQAEALAAEIEAWRGGLRGEGMAVSVDKHTDRYAFQRAGWHHPLMVGAIEVGGCRVLGIDWEPADHSMSHHGERALGQVYPVTLEADGSGGTVLRWTIRPEDADEEDGYR
ncbi:hypothetical protein [Kitasatospora sp. A2-31]|uniref:hypothetical protein n=1 Tax=Kitasatospora sp. A2-31 TaxID=2916414 RepID=UPI001EEAA026|nr:hypothetical protein [Kitasatospora sp. A2-31]MCG6494100.1 hypothetical protein [Kitasatospora sp. A2-31]